MARWDTSRRSPAGLEPAAQDAQDDASIKPFRLTGNARPILRSRWPRPWLAHRIVSCETTHREQVQACGFVRRLPATRPLGQPRSAASRFL